jgi:hypothetical protein
VRTNGAGEFHLDERTRHVGLVRKRVMAFAADATGAGEIFAVPISVGSFRRAAHVSLSLRSFDDQQQSHFATVSKNLNDVSHASVNRRLLSLATIERSDVCGDQGWAFVSKVFEMSVPFASTLRDEEFVKANCEQLRQDAKAHNRRRSELSFRHLRNEAEYKFDYDCDRLFR